MTRASPHLLLIAICSVLVSLPLWLHGPSCGHDFDFHLQSWLAVRQAWHDGLLSPHWVAGANYNAGEPRLIFYPPASWLLSALLGLVLPWTIVAQALTTLALAGCGFAFYGMARRWLRPPVAAACACLYLGNPYLLFVAYERTAYGELLGAVLLPLALGFSLRPRAPIAGLAAVVAALWFTNAPTAVMGCYLIAFCALATVAYSRSLAPLGRAAAGLALGAGLAADYILPAWYQQRWVEIANAFGPEMRVEDSFLFGHRGEAFHVMILHTASRIAVTVLGVGLATLALYPLAARARVQRPAGQNTLLAATLTAILLAILFLQLPWSDPIWRFAPQLRFLQFPWRWLLVAGVATPLAIGLLAQTSKPVAGPRRLWALAAAVVFAAWAAGRYAQHAFAQACDEDDNVVAQLGLLHPSADSPPTPGDPQGIGFQGTDEYASQGADKGQIQIHLPPVRLVADAQADQGDDSVDANPTWKPTTPRSGERTTIQLWQPEHKQLILKTRQRAWAVLRLLDYPAWRVLVNGQPVAFAARPHREDGLLTLPLPSGETRIEILWQTTPEVWAGRALSLISLATLAGLVAWRRKSLAAQAPL